MKRLSSAIILAMISTSIMADVATNPENPYQIYVTGDIHVKHVRDKDRADRAKLLMSGGGIGVGFKFGDYVGAELGGHIAKRKKYGSRYTHQGVSAQIMGYVPFESVALVGGVGLAQTSIAVQNTEQKQSDHRHIPKASLGFMIHITDNVATRYMASLEKTSKIGKIHDWDLKDSLHHQLGIVYTF